MDSNNLQIYFEVQYFVLWYFWSSNGRHMVQHRTQRKTWRNVKKEHPIDPTPHPMYM